MSLGPSSAASVERGRCKRPTDDEASNPTLSMNSKGRGRLLFDEQNVGPGYEEAAEAEDAKKENRFVGLGGLG